MSTSMPQSVVQTQVDALYFRLFNSVTQVPIDLVGTNTITIFSPGNTELVAATSVGLTVSDNVATFQRTWDAATFPRSYQPTTTSTSKVQNRNYYRARWTLNTGAYTRDVYFEVIRRRFMPTLLDADFTDRYSYLVPQLPTGQTNFTAFRKRSWERITHLIQQRIGRNAGDLYLPETFSLCHEYWSLADFFLANMFDAVEGGEDKYKAERYEKMGTSAFEAAMSQVLVDTNDDGIVSTEDETYHFAGVRVIR